MSSLNRDGVRKRTGGTLGLLKRLVFPPTCAGCNVAETWLCERCRESLIDLRAEPDIRLGARMRSGDLFMARYHFAEPIRRAIHLLKYEGQRSRAGWLAGELMPLLEVVSTSDSLLQPVPLSAERIRSRGFNQAHEICLALSSRTGHSVVDGVARVRHTRPQVELKGADRIANVQGAFRASRAVAGRHIVLVDDVVTTGATMRECASACYAAGAAIVSGLAVASG